MNKKIRNSDAVSAINYLNGFSDYEKTTGYSYTSAYFNLARMRDLLDRLGNPQRFFKTIHIAGTKGKGSTAAMAASILKAAGFKTGLYTSPHIVSFCERVQVNARMISENELVSLVRKIRPAVVELMKETDFGMPTFFEVYTALAFLYFSVKKVDVAVVEVGLGGRLDATNVITPEVCGITPVSMDHTSELGNTVESIAGEKAGIIKEGIPVVSAQQEPEAMKVIEEVCRKKNARFFCLGREYRFRVVRTDLSGNIAGIATPFWKGEKRFYVPLLGTHQAGNAMMAIGLVLNAYPEISADKIRKGLRAVRLPGRLEIRQHKPMVILDGAHNAASGRVLADSLKKLFKFRRLILVVGMAINKDIASFGRELSPLADLVIFTRTSDNPRAALPEKIKELWNAGHCLIEPDVVLAVKKAIASAGENGMVCITGSFYVVGEAEKFFRN